MSEKEDRVIVGELSEFITLICKNLEVRKWDRIIPEIKRLKKRELKNKREKVSWFNVFRRKEK